MSESKDLGPQEKAAFEIIEAHANTDGTILNRKDVFTIDSLIPNPTATAVAFEADWAEAQLIDSLADKSLEERGLLAGFQLDAAVKRRLNEQGLLDQLKADPEALAAAKLEARYAILAEKALEEAVEAEQKRKDWSEQFEYREAEMKAMSERLVPIFDEVMERARNQGKVKPLDGEEVCFLKSGDPTASSVRVLALSLDEHGTRTIRIEYRNNATETMKRVDPADLQAANKELWSAGQLPLVVQREVITFDADREPAYYDERRLQITVAPVPENVAREYPSVSYKLGGVKSITNPQTAFNADLAETILQTGHFAD